ncbi:phage terminase large subunit family protein [Wolbachia endosymbiont of Folsomia candida]|uniref:phage terminase large subunit family protein n=1 Tax=Wolbachia endosymbiont of Folsomia candida TaxID=169402 RepID=UPI000A49A7EE|nr:phage terminase large subunit family protein [Wolbachia endosymbiont of Folsomia candida]APR98999.1 phage terminase large subunit family protein [Wolbachia endosymbiont of Folsomia candida]
MIYATAFYAGLKPDPLLKVSEWSDEYRVLSQTASSEPGKWRTERTPYLKEVMDSLSPSSPVEKVIFMKGAQIGGTEAGNNWIGYIIDQTPGPMLVVQPTVEMGKRWSKGRFAPLIENTPCLKDKVKDPRSRDSGNTVQSKEFPGGIVVITGANSSVGLRSMPVKYLFLDEIDAYPGDSSGEGDPVLLSIARTNTFTRRKIFLVSTPTVHGISRIEKEFESSDKRYFFVPCPQCNYYQVLKWPQIKWENNDPKTAHYVCIECKGKIENHQKIDMLAKGEWRATDSTKDGKTAGFHISSLYSPVGWYSWSQAVAEFLHSKDNEQLLKVWINTVLGETWVDRGEVPDWKHLFERRESYTIGTIPEGEVVLTAGVDVQKDRLEVEVVAWGKGRKSWSIDYQVFEGDPGAKVVWNKLSELLNHHFLGPHGVEYTISMMAVDAGYATQEVYNWVRSHQGSGRVMAVKGINKALVPLNSPSRVDITVSGKKLRRGMKLWPVGVSILKSELFQLLNISQNEEAGYCHFPEYSPEYFKQLTAEQLITKVVKGYTKQEWQKIRDRNEALDCRIYARAASIALGIDRWQEANWNSLAGEKAESKKKSEKIRKSKWLHEK